MATFSLLIVRFFFKINRVQAVNDRDKKCKFHENLTTNADFYDYTRKANFQLKMATFPSLTKKDRHKEKKIIIIAPTIVIINTYAYHVFGLIACHL